MSIAKGKKDMLLIYTKGLGSEGKCCIYFYIHRKNYKNIYISIIVVKYLYYF